jgi:hypothetical protein
MKIQEEKSVIKEIAYLMDISKTKKKRKKLSVMTDGFTQEMSAWFSQMDQLRSSIEQRTFSSCLRVNILRQKSLKISISNLLMLHKYLFMDALYKAG